MDALNLSVRVSSPKGVDGFAHTIGLNREYIGACGIALAGPDRRPPGASRTAGTAGANSLTSCCAPSRQRPAGLLLEPKIVNVSCTQLHLALVQNKIKTRRRRADERGG